MTTMTGPPEAWFLSGYESFGAWGKDQHNVEQSPALLREVERLAAQDGELLSGVRSVVGVYREDLSYRPNIKVGEMRYFTVTTLTVRPGYDSAFADARKVVNAGHEKANMDEHFAIYQVVSGMPGPAYLIFIPMKSLEEVDVAGEPQEAVPGRARRGGSSAAAGVHPGWHREWGVRPFRA